MDITSRECRFMDNSLAQDQVSSTRIVTDGAGAVVYSSAHGPFGDTQTTWTNSYEPKQQYSGKEREYYSQFDYFGARYYDNSNYRFLSVDPIRNKDEALANPQLWNLYSYCRNNPITYLDPDGKLSAKFELIEHPVERSDQIPNNPYRRTGVNRPVVKTFKGESVLIDGKYFPRFSFEMDDHIWYVENVGGVRAHEWRHGRDMLSGFEQSLFLLRIAENTSFESSAACQSFLKAVGQAVESHMTRTQKSSYNKRDTIWGTPVEVASMFTDWILGKSEGNGLPRVYDWDK